MTTPPGFVPVGVADGVRAAARWSPGKVCLQHGERTIDFRSLVERIDRVANLAGGLGLRPGDRAAIMASNSIEFIEIVLGLSSAGVATAMVNARYEPQEVAYVCDDAQARLLFVDARTAERARAADLPSVEHIVEIGPDYERRLADARPVPPGVAVQEWDPFCIPYTAGTTGEPKGVLLPHRARSLTFFAMGVEYGCYGPRDRALAIAPMFHGAGFAFSVAPIFFGGFCAIHDRFEPERVLADLDDLAITNVFLVPTHFSAIFALEDSVLARHHHRDLRTIISNAAPLAQTLKERIVEEFGDDVLFEAYGSTEASIVSNLRPPDQLRKEQCVGLPFPCTQVRLVGDDGEEVAPGEVGELFSRSPFLFSGYWNRPQDTGEAIRDGWVTAGDLARTDDEGYLYIVDRKNDKIISGGINIYPREVEEALLRHEAVAEVGAYGVPDAYWGETVQATVALKPGRSVSAEELLASCEGLLARYKLPKRIRFAPQLPRNAAGKVLRRELREAASGDTSDERP